MKVAFKDKAHTFTHDEQVKGGQQVSVYKSLARTLGMRKYCRTDCAFFEKCPVNAMSYGSPERKCMMKEFPATVKQRFINMFLTGEEGVVHELKTIIHAYMNEVDAYGTLKDKRDMVQILLQFYDKVYNNPRKPNMAKEPLTITIRRVGVPAETMTVMPREALTPGKVKVRDITNPVNEDITEDDPESLMQSPVLERILREPPKTYYAEEIKIETNVERLLEENNE